MNSDGPQGVDISTPVINQLANLPSMSSILASAYAAEKAKNAAASMSDSVVTKPGEAAMSNPVSKKPGEAAMSNPVPSFTPLVPQEVVPASMPSVSSSATVQPPSSLSLTPIDHVDSKLNVPLVATGGLPPGSRKNIKICFNGIVKNEKNVMLRRLKNIAHSVDAIAITDTGSTDNTIEIIEQFGKDSNIPTRVDKEEMVDFEVNRTAALRFAEKFVMEVDPAATWYLMMGDADDLNFGGDPAIVQTLPEDKRPLFPSFDKTTFGSDTYQVMMASGISNYVYTWMIKLKQGRVWEWKTPIHEYLRIKSDTSKEPPTISLIKGGYVESRREGSRTLQDDKKYFRDALTFERALMKPDCDRFRCVFYLAQSYRDCNLYDQSYRRYAERANMGGYEGEVYCSLMEMFNIRFLHKKKHDGKLIEIGMRALDIDPRRLEVPYFLVRFYNGRSVGDFKDSDRIDEMRSEIRHLRVQMDTLKKNSKHIVIERQGRNFDNAGKMNTMAWTIAQPFLNRTLRDDFLFSNIMVYDHLFYIESGYAAFYAALKTEMLEGKAEAIKIKKQSRDLLAKAVASKYIDPQRKDQLMNDLRKFYKDIV